MKELFDGVFDSRGKILTKNLVPGTRVYGEKLFNVRGVEYREWIPFRSKLCAGIKNGLKELPLSEGKNVLYLGVAEGTTASHLSDIIGKKGALFGVDVAEKTMKKFLSVCESRENLVPVLADAGKPEEYAEYLKGIKIGLLYQDVSQKNQAKIFNRNASAFLKKGACGIIAIKAQSISSTRPSGEIFDAEEKELRKEFSVKQAVNLRPFEKDHMLYILEKK